MSSANQQQIEAIIGIIDLFRMMVREEASSAVRDVLSQSSMTSRAPMSPKEDRGVEFMTAREAAEILRVKPRKVRNLIKEGKLDATRIGREYRVRRASIDSLATRNEELDRTSCPIGVQPDDIVADILKSRRSKKGGSKNGINFQTR
jgi:excisionase family DNA binding protein